jgi:hypothetical protein
MKRFDPTRTAQISVLQRFEHRASIRAIIQAALFFRLAEAAK